MNERVKITAPSIRARKGKGPRILALTAYDYFTARLADQAGMDIILVGDSLAMVVLGYENTLPVSVFEMLHHTRAAARGNRHCLLIADMPFLSYHLSDEQALKNAGRFVQRAGAGAVKLEGGEKMAARAGRIVAAGIPVLGHIGLTPQDILALGGWKVAGRQPAAAKQLLADARALQNAGVFALVLECVPAELADEITASVKIPTIGIGAGPGCDGQILVSHDLLGIQDKVGPRFVKRYADLSGTILSAFKEWAEDVRSGRFPGPEHCY